MPALQIPGTDLAIMFPVDLPEGGFLQIVTGSSLLAPPAATLQVPRGGIVAMLAPEAVRAIFPNLAQLPDDSPPIVMLPNLSFQLPGDALPILNCAFLRGAAVLNVVVGPNPQKLPQPSTPCVAGTLLGLVPPEASDRIRQGIAASRAGVNPFAIGVERNGA